MRSQPRTLSALPLVVLSLFVVTTCVAQESRSHQTTAAPPLKFISPDDRVQINEAKDPKGRVRRLLILAEARLVLAEQHTSRQEYEAALTQVGNYWALVDNALSFLGTLARDTNQTRDLYKRVELTLRAQGPRLTSLRRTTPLEYAVWIKEVEDFAREGRTEALNSFYGHTVMKEGKSAPAAPANKIPNDPTRPPEER
jgi:hypothetical protein